MRSDMLTKTQISLMLPGRSSSWGTSTRGRMNGLNVRWMNVGRLCTLTAVQTPTGRRNGSETRANRDARIQQKNRRSEEHTSELQSLMRNSYAVFCLKKKTNPTPTKQQSHKNNTRT